MRKINRFLALLFLLSLVLLSCPSLADTQEGWICPNCGQLIPFEDLYCPNHTPQDRDQAGSAPGSWPKLTLPEDTAKLRNLGDSEQRHQAYYGPGKTYADAGAYKPAKATRVIPLFVDGEYVLADMSYQTAGRRCLYFRRSVIDGTLPSEMPSGYVSAKTASLLIPMLGPGTEYQSLVQSTPSKYENWSVAELAGKFGGSWEIYEALKPQLNTVYLEPETEVNVFFEVDGWAFAEFRCPVGLVRAWIPADKLN